MTTETKVLNCINCPLSCELTATVEDGVVMNVTGNYCPRGAQYAKEELTAPTRHVEGGRLPLLPVVSAKKVPKGRVVECAEALRTVSVKAPVHAGDVVAANILGLGVDIVASRDMETA